METTITICGWVLFGVLTAALAIFAGAFIYGFPDAFLQFSWNLHQVQKTSGKP